MTEILDDVEFTTRTIGPLVLTNLWCQLLQAELGNGPMEHSVLVRMYPIP